MDEKDFVNIIVNDMVQEDNADQLFDVIFKQEVGIDTESFIKLIKKRYEGYKHKLSPTDQVDLKKCINSLSKNSSLLDNILLNLKLMIIKENKFNYQQIMYLDSEMFWAMYAMAIKKCAGNTKKSLPDIKQYLDELNILTNQQRRAYEACFNTYAIDIAQTSINDFPGLSNFLPPLRSNKKIKTRKKNIKRAVNKTNKIMNVKKINARNERNNIFVGKCHVVPKKFSAMVIKYVLAK